MRGIYKTKNTQHDRKHIICHFKRQYFEKNEIRYRNSEGDYLGMI